VRTAVAAQPGQGAEVPADGNRSTPLPPALEGTPPRGDSDRTPPTATSLPADSDETALEAIAATGKPLTLPEAIDLAVHSQPRLRAQLESIAQARGQQQIAFSTFLPLVAGRYDAGMFSLGVAGESIRLGNGLPGFNFIPGLGALPVGLNFGTTFELAELKVQWLLLDFGRRLARFEQGRLALDAGHSATHRALPAVANPA